MGRLHMCVCVCVCVVCVHVCVFVYVCVCLSVWVHVCEWARSSRSRLPVTEAVIMKSRALATIAVMCLWLQKWLDFL